MRLPVPCNAGFEPESDEMMFAESQFRRPGLREIALLLVLIALLGGNSARSQVPLYEAEVAWSEDDADARETAFRKALHQVLVKVTGRRHVPDTSQSEPIVQSAQGLVQQYQIRTAEARSGDATVHEPSLWVRFDDAAVDRLVRAAGLPVWSRTRPSILAWVAAGIDGTLRAVGSEGTEIVAEILRRATESRGVPLMLPLFDLEDQTQAGSPELWVEAGEQIRAASERYQAGAILVGRIDSEVLWESKWLLLLPDAVERWEGVGAGLELLVDEGVQEAVDSLAARYSSIAPRTEPSAIVASISGVHDFMGYARTLRYLESLDEIESIEVLAAVSGRLRLKLKLRTDVTGLRGLLALGSTLVEDAGNVDGALALRLLQ